MFTATTASAQPEPGGVYWCTDEDPTGYCMGGRYSVGRDLQPEPSLARTDGHPDCTVWLAHNSQVESVTQVWAVVYDDFYDEWFGDSWTAYYYDLDSCRDWATPDELIGHYYSEETFKAYESSDMRKGLWSKPWTYDELTPVLRFDFTYVFISSVSHEILEIWTGYDLH